ncbi:fungal-specific transcription factor domain-containing protein [Aspergillus avenaceus]|uniref:Fungal-specific transcription factor domain-containing protein n=1 Tax=Aspergillus avenaceus TaxID=36643 RepID=A0A5N6U5I2_ASPAV|nr:fungal-specific transcription factor domain-containing protein [Aspergillus avenaceus]
MYHRQICKSCEPCRLRKVRCNMSLEDPSRCTHCIKRDEHCEFKHTKRRSKRESPQLHYDENYKHGAPLFIDRLLDSHPTQGPLPEGASILKSEEHEVTSSNIAFFSDRKIQSLTQRLGNTRLKELVECIETVIEGRITAQGTTVSPVTFKKPPGSVAITPEDARLYVDVYFQRIHPIYPFIDRQDFERIAFSPSLPRELEGNAPFSALYHTVLALGCQYHDGGTFDPGKGKAWKLFQMSLGLMADILVPRESLLNVQALAAMSIFAMNTCCLQIDEILIMEAARMAQALRYHRAIRRTGNEAFCQRTFWVIYAMEKHLAFRNRESSLIGDYDVGCPIPETPEAVFGSYNWFLSSLRYARILSQAYEMLFSTSAAQNSIEGYSSAIEHVQRRLEDWRQAVPEEFRPGDAHHPHTFADPVCRMVALETHYSYYSLVIALARLTLQISLGDGVRQHESKRNLMLSARRVVELTQYIDKAAHTPLFVLAIMPLVALFILFDFVVHNPTHPETKPNLSMLDICSGHFALVEHASGGSLPCSLVSEFAHIARHYVRDVRIGKNSQEIPQSAFTSTHSLPGNRPLPEFGAGSSSEWPPQKGNGDEAHLGDSVPVTEELAQYEELELFNEPDYLYYPTMDEIVNLGDDPMMPGFDLRTLFGSVIPTGFDSPGDNPTLDGIMSTPPT